MVILFVINYLFNYVYFMEGKYEVGVYFCICYGLCVCKIKYVQNSKFQVLIELKLIKIEVYYKQFNDMLFYLGKELDLSMII